jgi:hypothetical protein
MRLHQAAFLYPESAYDANLCLKPSPLLWVVVVYLSREITLPFAMGMAQMAGVNSQALAAIRALWHLDFSIVPALFSAIVLVVFFRRVPKAGRVVRWLWAHGAALLALSSAGDLALSVAAIVSHGELNDVAVLNGLTALASTGSLVYVLLSARVRDSFADFPAPP